MSVVHVMLRPRLDRALRVLLLGFVLAAAGSPAAAGAAPGPAWTIVASSSPTNFAPEDTTGDDSYEVTAINTGAVPAEGSEEHPIRIRDLLPAGVTAAAISGVDPTQGFHALNCSPLPNPAPECSYAGAVPPGAQLRVKIVVDVEVGPSKVPNEARVAGGGALEASTTDSTTISATPAAFGLSSFVTASSTTQAGGHPNLTTSFTLNQALFDKGELNPSEPVKDIRLALPRGVVGNATSVPQCTTVAVQAHTCPANAAVGVIVAVLSFTGSPEPYSDLVYNVVPYAGEPAAFMAAPGNYSVRLDTSVRSGEDYGVNVSVSDASETTPLLSSAVTLWGVPAEFNGPGTDETLSGQKFGGRGGGEVAPFTTNPVDCGGEPLETVLSPDSWLTPGNFNNQYKSFNSAPTDCEALSFNPALSVQPDTFQADEPAGYDVDIKVPQNESPSGLATPELRDATITLPPGVALSPAAADGLQACTDEQIALHELGPGSCPAASQIATVKVSTPLLARPLEGQLFVGAPTCSPCTNADAQDGSLFRLFLQAQGSGVTVKLAGAVSANPQTGQLTATFKNNPQLPFSDLQVQLKGGPRAPLANPQTCGDVTATSDLSPWSSPVTPDATPSSPLTIDWDGSIPPAPGMPLTGNAGCPASLPFGPGFLAESAYSNAAAFTPFSVTFSRRDREQDLSQVSVRAPRGLLGMLSQVPLCGEPQAQQGTCPGSSRIGTTTVGAGAGSHPFYVSGPVYLTGPYKGGPFGLSVAVPAVAGPFNLGTVIVRAQIHVDPNTSQITVLSDPLPQIIDGVPLRIQTVNVTVDRPAFMFNPTNCVQQQVTATVTAAQGASAPVSSAFDVGGCQNLPFKPGLTASTQAKTSKINGASLTVKVASGAGQANIARVDLQLPLALPSRLSTLQKACTEAQFNSNPAACPPGSVIGHANAFTPVLNAPLNGPAILVSHGGAAFPDVEFILQGQGVTIVLDGKTDIKKGITYSHFDTVPDAPISSFETVLPEGPHSILGAYLAKGTLCTSKLLMPTTITGQNGAVIKQTTKIAVTGCPKVKKASRARKAKRARRARQR